MAAESIKNAFLTLAGVDLSDHVTALSLSVTEADPGKTTAMGDDWETDTAEGVKSFTLDVTFLQDFAASETYATIYPLFGTVATFSAKKENVTTASTNPEFSGSVRVKEIPIIDATHGQLHTIQVSWPGTGALTETTGA